MYKYKIQNLHISAAFLGLDPDTNRSHKLTYQSDCFNSWDKIAHKKCRFGLTGICIRVSAGFNWLGYCQVPWCFENGNEILGSIKGEEFSYKLSKYELLRLVGKLSFLILKLLARWSQQEKNLVMTMQRDVLDIVTCAVAPGRTAHCSAPLKWATIWIYSYSNTQRPS